MDKLRSERKKKARRMKEGESLKGKERGDGKDVGTVAGTMKVWEWWQKERTHQKGTLAYFVNSCLVFPYRGRRPKIAHDK